MFSNNERQRRYREQHREELKQREAERGKRQQNVQLSANDLNLVDLVDLWIIQQNLYNI